MSLKEVEFEGCPPWGFRMNGGADAGHPLRISRVNPGSKAELKGVREGDLITSINGEQTKCLTNSESHALLRTVKENLRLGLNEDSSPKRKSKEKSASSEPDSSKESIKPSSSKARRRRRSKLKIRFKELLGFRETSGKVINLHPYAKEEKEPEESEEVEVPSETVVLVHNPRDVADAIVSIDDSSDQKLVDSRIVLKDTQKVDYSASLSHGSTSHVAQTQKNHVESLIQDGGPSKQKESACQDPLLVNSRPLKANDAQDSKNQDAICCSRQKEPSVQDSRTPLKIDAQANEDKSGAKDGSSKQEEACQLVNSRPLKASGSQDSKNQDAISCSREQKGPSGRQDSHTPLKIDAQANHEDKSGIQGAKDGSSKQEEACQLVNLYPLKTNGAQDSKIQDAISCSREQKGRQDIPLKIDAQNKQDKSGIQGAEESSSKEKEARLPDSILKTSDAQNTKPSLSCSLEQKDSSATLQLASSGEDKSVIAEGSFKHKESSYQRPLLVDSKIDISSTILDIDGLSFPEDNSENATEVLICSPQLEIPVIKYEDEHIYEPVKVDIQAPHYPRRYLEVINEETSDLSESDKAEKTSGSQDGIDTSWRDGKSLEEVSDVPVLSDSDSDVLEKKTEKRPSISVVKNVISSYCSKLPVIDKVSSSTHEEEKEVEIVYIDSSDSELFSSVLSSQSSDSIDTIITDVQETARAMMSDEFLSGSEASLAKVLSLKELSLGAVMKLQDGPRLFEEVEDPVSLPEIYDGWVGIPVPDSRLLVCLSPTQMKNSKSKDASQLLDLHEKFIQRRGYHETDEEFLALQKYHQLRQKKMKSSHEVGNSRLLELFQTLDLQSSNDNSISRKMKDDRPNSAPLSGEAFRERMYEEYMSKLYDLAERRNSKVLKLSSTTNSVPNVNTLQIQSEFMSKVKERMAKLGIPCEQQKTEENSQPKHLRELLELTKECSVWSPCSTPEAERKKFDFEKESPKKKKEEKEEPSPPIWTPKSAGPSPTFERKFRSVNFQSPPPKRKEIQPKEEPELPKDLPIEPNSRLVSSTSENSSLNSSAHALRLPSAQNPTITLLQKAREGHIPKGAQYLEDTKTSQETSKYSVKNEYYTEEDGNTKHVIELTPKKFEGIGPTTREGIPIGLRSEVKEDNQQKWYKRMYDSLHKAEHDSQYPYSGGYVSEPERLNYDSDASISKYATLDRRKIKNKENDFTSSTLPRNRYGAGVRHAVNIYKNQPGRIEDYEPGRSSISESEAKQWWDEVLDIFDGELNQQSRNHYYSTPERSPRSFTYALKDTGYDSDSTLVFRRRENNMSQQLSPADQKEAYKVIQRGGEVPLSGLRKAAPERPKENTEIEYFPLSPTLTRIRVHKKPEEKLFYPVNEEPVFGSYKRTAKSSVVPSPPRRLSSLRMIADEKMGKTTSKMKKDVKKKEVLRKSPELKAPAEVKKALKTPETKKNIKISVAVTKERKSPTKIPSPEIKKVKKDEKKIVPAKTSRLSSRPSTPKIEEKPKIKKEPKKKPETIIKNIDKKKKTKKKESDKENVPEEKKFFQNLLLREKTPVRRSPSVIEKSKKFSESHNFKGELKNLNYLKQKKAVSESRFRSLERHELLDKIDRFDSQNVWENPYESIKSRSSSEPRSDVSSPVRSPSLRRIRRSSKNIESVVGVKKRSKSLNEERTASPEARKSRFKELHKFYSSLERMAELEKTTSSIDLRPRLKNEEVIDFDRWKNLRNKEKAEIELNNLYSKLIVDQKEKDLLFQPKETVRWQGDIGLRSKEKSVEDLRQRFQKMSVTPLPSKDIYKPLWRGNSVLNLAQNLTKNKEPKKEIKKPIKSKEIGSRLWSSLSMDQVNALKNQLSEIYSTVSNLKKERIQKMRQNIQNYEMNVAVLSPPESLRVRSNSLLSPEVPKIEKSNSISSGLSEPEKKKMSMTLSAEVKERMKNVVIPKETLGAVAAQKGKDSPISEGSSKNLLLVLAPKEDWEKKSSSGSSISTVIHLENRLFPSQSYSDLKELFGETYVQKPFFNSVDSLSPDPMKYYRAYLSHKGEVRKLKEKFESYDDIYNLRKESPVRKMYQSDPDLTRDFLSKNDKIKGQEQGDVKSLKKKYEKTISPVPFRVKDRLMPHINVISNKALLMKGNVEKLKDHFERKMSLLGQMYTSTPEITELRDIAPYLECDWVAHRNVRSPMPKRRSASASPLRHSILKDVFANQPFDPEIHRPLYRYQPDNRPTVTFKEPSVNPIPTPPRDLPRLRNQESPHRYVESEVNIHYRSPIRSEAKGVWPEDELAEKQAEIMRRIYQEQRRTKYLNELHDMYSRRHTDNFIPSQKSPIPLNRYDDFPVDVQPPRPRDRTPEPKLVARALFNFVGQTSRELTFRRGDIIYVRRQIDKNWYEGEHNAMIGLFPFNYVEIIPYDGIRTLPKKASEGQARAKFNFQAQSHLELSLVKGELVLLTRRVDENWFEGRIGTRKGIFPVSYVEVLVEPGERAMSPSVPISMKPIVAPASHSVMLNGAKDLGQQHYQPPRPALYNSSSLPPQSKYGDISMVNQTLHIDTQNDPVPYRVLYNYRPQNEDELELKEGDVVYVMEKCDDGWYVGSLHRNGQFGTFPGNYVERIQ